MERADTEEKTSGVTAEGVSADVLQVVQSLVDEVERNNGVWYIKPA